MICHSCNEDNREGRKFCAGCGSRLTLTCEGCGTPNEVGESFCGECGAPLGRPADQRSPAAYTPKHLADKILQSKSALEGERKQVTVMFADVKGSMDIAEHLGPEEWHRTLDCFFEILAEGVHRFEGTVNQYTGDGIMALFGAPIAHEDHAQRACYAALQLRDQLQSFAEEVRHTHGVDFSTRIGLNSGEVIVGKIGDDLRMDYTAQGHTVGLAQRMEALAEAGKPYVSQATANLVQGYFELDDQGEFNVKGAAEPMRVYALLDTGAARTRVDSASAKDLSKFVGREDELATLIHAYEESDAGRGQVVGIVAGPGLGKSRLVKEFIDHIEKKGAWVSLSNCPAHGQDISLLNYIEAIRSQYGIETRDNSQTIQGKLRTSFLQQFGELNDGYALMCDLVGAPDPEHPVPPVNPEEQQRRYMQWEKRAAEGRKDMACYVIVIEDVHWIDSGSCSLLDEGTRWTPDHRQMLLLTQRPEYTPPWVTRSFYRQIPLLPLGHDAVDELTTALLGPNVAESGLNALIRDRCGGTPFFIEECIQSLAETGFLGGERGNYTLAKPVDEIPLPATVQAVLAARIDRLGEGDKRLLQTASIIGRVFPLQVLKAVSEESEAAIDAALQSLLNAELIYEHAIHPDVEYIFKHALTQDVAYASQLTERRESIHALVAEALENHYVHQLDEKSALIAQHWENAGEALSAIRWQHRAAKWAGRTDFAASAFHWSRVRALVRTLPRTAESNAMGLLACTNLLTSSWRIGLNAEEAEEINEEGSSYADALGDPRAHHRLALNFNRAILSTGNVRESIESARAIRRAVLQIDDVVLQSHAWSLLVDALGHGEASKTALDDAENGLTRFPRDIPPEEWLFGMSPFSLLSLWRGVCLYRIGRIPEGIEELDRCMKNSEKDRSSAMIVFARSYAADACRYAGLADQALVHAQHAQGVARDLGNTDGMVAFAHMGLCQAHLVAGRAAEAIKSARAALDRHRRVERQLEGVSALLLAESLLMAGDWAVTIRAAEEAISICKRTARGMSEAIAHGVRARALIRLDGANALDAAEATLTEVVTLIKRTGATTLNPSLLEWRAEIAEIKGDTSMREQLLRQASEGYRRIGAPKHAERLSKELNS